MIGAVEADGERNGAGLELTTGVAERNPKRPTRNTSMSFPLALVVTISRDPLRT
jgi:hypothetical protein